MTAKKREPLILAANRELTEWEKMLTESIEAMHDAEDMTGDPVASAAVVALTKGFSAISGYENMGPIEKAYAAMHILFDAVDSFILANFDRYMDAYESGEYDPEDTTEEGYDDE